MPRIDRNYEEKVFTTAKEFLEKCKTPVPKFNLKYIGKSSFYHVPPDGDYEHFKFHVPLENYEILDGDHGYLIDPKCDFRVNGKKAVVSSVYANNEVYSVKLPIAEKGKGKNKIVMERVKFIFE